MLTETSDTTAQKLVSIASGSKNLATTAPLTSSKLPFEQYRTTVINHYSQLHGPHGSPRPISDTPTC